MKIMMSLIATAALAAATAMPAAAQVPGTYSGTTADGQTVSFTVATDPNTGVYALSTASINFVAPCRNQDYTLYTGWGFGLEADIVNRRVTTTQQGSYFYFIISLTFSRDGQSATGTLLSMSPTLFPASGRPTTTAFCESPKQALTLSLQPDTGSTSVVKPNHQLLRPNLTTETAKPNESNESDE